MELRIHAVLIHCFRSKQDQGMKLRKIRKSFFLSALASLIASCFAPFSRLNERIDAHHHEDQAENRHQPDKEKATSVEARISGKEFSEAHRSATCSGQEAEQSDADGRMHRVFSHAFVEGEQSANQQDRSDKGGNQSRYGPF